MYLCFSQQGGCTQGNYFRTEEGRWRIDFRSMWQKLEKFKLSIWKVFSMGQWNVSSASHLASYGLQHAHLILLLPRTSTVADWISIDHYPGPHHYSLGYYYCLPGHHHHSQGHYCCLPGSHHHSCSGCRNRVSCWWKKLCINGRGVWNWRVLEWTLVRQRLWGVRWE